MSLAGANRGRPSSSICIPSSLLSSTGTRTFASADESTGASNRKSSSVSRSQVRDGDHDPRFRIFFFLTLDWKLNIVVKRGFLSLFQCGRRRHFLFYLRDIP